MLFTVLSALVALQVPPSDQLTCEVNVWQTKNYSSGSASPNLGLIGAIVKDINDAKYPANTVLGIMEHELRPEALVSLVERAPWAQYFGSRLVRVAIQPEIVDKRRIKELRATKVRNSASAASCYLELYLSDQIFEGSFIKSHLLNNFTIRDFRSGGYVADNTIVYSVLKKFPAKDEESLPIALENFRNAFVRNLTTFLGKKLKKSGPV